MLNWLKNIIKNKIVVAIGAGVLVVALGLGLGLGLGLKRSGGKGGEEPQPKAPVFTEEQLQFFGSLEKPNSNRTKATEVVVPQNLLSENEKFSDIWYSGTDFLVAVVEKTDGNTTNSTVEFFEVGQNSTLSKVVGGVVLDATNHSFVSKIGSKLVVSETYVVMTETTVEEKEKIGVFDLATKTLVVDFDSNLCDYFEIGDFAFFVSETTMDGDTEESYTITAKKDGQVVETFEKVMQYDIEGAYIIYHTPSFYTVVRYTTENLKMMEIPSYAKQGDPEFSLDLSHIVVCGEEYSMKCMVNHQFISEKQAYVCIIMLTVADEYDVVLWDKYHANISAMMVDLETGEIEPLEGKDTYNKYFYYENSDSIAVREVTFDEEHGKMNFYNSDNELFFTAPEDLEQVIMVKNDHIIYKSIYGAYYFANANFSDSFYIGDESITRFYDNSFLAYIANDTENGFVLMDYSGRRITDLYNAAGESSNNQIFFAKFVSATYVEEELVETYDWFLYDLKSGQLTEINDVDSGLSIKMLRIGSGYIVVEGQNGKQLFDGTHLYVIDKIFEKEDCFDVFFYENSNRKYLRIERNFGSVEQAASNVSMSVDVGRYTQKSYNEDSYAMLTNGSSNSTPTLYNHFTSVKISGMSDSNAYVSSSFQSSNNNSVHVNDHYYYSSFSGTLNLYKPATFEFALVFSHSTKNRGGTTNFYGGTVSVLNSNRAAIVDIGKTIGYTIGSWTLKRGDKVLLSSGGGSTMLSTTYYGGDTNCIITLTPISVTVTYSPGNRQTGRSDQATVSYNSTYSKISSYTNLAWTGYSFLCWGTTNDISTAKIVYETTKINKVENHAIYGLWTPNVYKVTLDNQGATTAGTTTIYEKYNDGFYYNAAASANNRIDAANSNGITKPKKTGYTFGGYYTGTNGTGTQYIDANGRMVSSASKTLFTNNDGKLYAKWTANEYDVEYDLNGTDEALCIGPTSNGSAGGVTYSYDKSTNILTINGKLTASTGKLIRVPLPNAKVGNSYEISIEKVGGTVSGGGCFACDFCAGTDANMSNRERHVTYEDIGYSGGTCTLKIQNNDNGKAIDRIGIWMWCNTSSPATFSNTQYKVTIKPLNGCKLGITATYDTQFSILTPTRDGYDFAGWNITGMDDISHTIGNSTTTKTSYSGTKATSFKNLRATSGTVKFTAKWAAKLYVKINGGGETQLLVDESVATKENMQAFIEEMFLHPEYFDKYVKVSYRSDSTVVLRGESFNKSVDTGSALRYNSDNSVVITLNKKPENSELVIKPTKLNNPLLVEIDYKIVTLKYNDTKIKDIICPVNTYINIGDHSYELDGYTFDGWYSDNNTKIESDTQVKYDTLYAHMTPNVYKVTLNNQEVTSAGTTAIYEKYNSGFFRDNDCTEKMTTNTNAITIPERTGYAFGGYYTEAGGNGTQFIDKNGKLVSGARTTNFTADGTLYAKWAANVYKVTLNNQEATSAGTTAIYEKYNSGFYLDINASIKKKMTESDNAITEPERTGYAFGGYYTEAGGNGTQFIGENGKLVSDVSTINFTKDDGTLYAKWTAIEYDISYDLRGGSFNSSNPTKATFDTPFSVSNPTREGYNFSGWVIYDITNVNEEKEINRTKDTEFNNLISTNNGEVKFIATWGANTYTATFHIKDKTETKECDYQEQVEKSAQLLGHTFDGWYSAQSGGTKISDEYGKFTYTWTGNKDFYARFSPITYKITLDNQSATDAGTQTIYEKYSTGYYSDAGATSALTQITKPERTGYTFGGYYSQAGGAGTKYINADGSLIANATTFERNTEIYASWTANTYNVVFNANGGTGSMSSQSFSYGTAQNLKANAFSKTGHLFVGWNTKSDGTGTNRSNGQSVSNLTETNDDTVTLYAIWETETYTVYFDANDGVLGTPTSISVTFDAQYGAGEWPTDPTRAGYTFDGWFTAKTGGTEIKGTTDVSDLGNDGATQTLYAHWTAKTFKITYKKYAPEGENTQTAIVVTDIVFGQSFTTMNANTFACTNWNLAQWNTKANGTGTQYDCGAEYVYDVDGDLVLCAIWTPKTITIKFDANGGTGEMDDQIVEYSKDNNLVSLDANAFSLENYKFVAWKNATGNTYADKNAVSYTGLISENVAQDGSITLYAVWGYDVEFVANDKNLKNKATAQLENKTLVKDSAEDVSIMAYDISHYTFVGCTTNANGTGTLYTGTIKGTDFVPENGKVVLYAQWTPTVYNITYVGIPDVGFANANPTTFTIEDENIVLASLTRTDNVKFVSLWKNYDGDVITEIETQNGGDIVVYAYVYYSILVDYMDARGHQTNYLGTDGKPYTLGGEDGKTIIDNTDPIYMFNPTKGYNYALTTNGYAYNDKTHGVIFVTSGTDAGKMLKLSSVVVSDLNGTKSETFFYNFEGDYFYKEDANNQEVVANITAIASENSGYHNTKITYCYDECIKLVFDTNGGEIVKREDENSQNSTIPYRVEDGKYVTYAKKDAQFVDVENFKVQKEGYVFAGWWVGNQEIDSTSTFGVDTTLTAKWKVEASYEFVDGFGNEIATTQAEEKVFENATIGSLAFIQSLDENYTRVVGDDTYHFRTYFVTDGAYAPSEAKLTRATTITIVLAKQVELEFNLGEYDSQAFAEPVIVDSGENNKYGQSYDFELPKLETRILDDKVYIHTGWMLDNEDVDELYAVSESKTFVAKWETRDKNMIVLRYFDGTAEEYREAYLAFTGTDTSPMSVDFSDFGIESLNNITYQNKNLKAVGYYKTTENKDELIWRVAVASETDKFANESKIIIVAGDVEQRNIYVYVVYDFADQQ